MTIYFSIKLKYSFLDAESLKLKENMHTHSNKYMNFMRDNFNVILNYKLREAIVTFFSLKKWLCILIFKHSSINEL